MLYIRSFTDRHEITSEERLLGSSTRKLSHSKTYVATLLEKFCTPEHHLRQAGDVDALDQTLIGECIHVLLSPCPRDRPAVSLSRASIVAGARGFYGIGSGNEVSTRDNIRSARHKTVVNERARGRLTENSRPQMIDSLD